LSCADCPYCGHEFYPDDYEELIDQGENEVECPVCEKIMAMRAESSIDYYTEKSPNENKNKAKHHGLQCPNCDTIGEYDFTDEYMGKDNTLIVACISCGHSGDIAEFFAKPPEDERRDN